MAGSFSLLIGKADWGGSAPLYIGFARHPLAETLISEVASMTYINSSRFHCVHSEQQTADPDELLVRAAQMGSCTAFSELYALYERRIFRTVRSITQNRQDAEDATQDAFLSAFKAISRFEWRSHFSSWLKRIAINSALMVLRKRRRCPELPLDLSHEATKEENCLAFHDKSANPLQTFECRERRSTLVKSIKKLKPRLRIVVEAQMSREGSAKDIAGRLQISEAAVKSRLHRARMRLSMASSVTTRLPHLGGGIAERSTS
jgi:RNA polymerase sigma-70 factor (ECF subfamily)